jgi:hypothetical protein
MRTSVQRSPVDRASRAVVAALVAISLTGCQAEGDERAATTARVSPTQVPAAQAQQPSVAARTPVVSAVAGGATASGAETEPDTASTARRERPSGTEAKAKAKARRPSITSSARPAPTDEPARSRRKPIVVFRNVMLIYRGAERDGQRWTHSDAEIRATRKAFLKTWPKLISMLTNGDVELRNDVRVMEETITSFTETGPDVEPLPGWRSAIGKTGRYDVAFIANAAPQNASWAAPVCCDTVRVPWVKVSKSDALGLRDATLAGWTHEWLHEIGDGFYREPGRLNLPNIPTLHSAPDHGYSPVRGGFNDWQAWYRDYMNKRVMINGVPSGLGKRAWRRGTLRTWLASGRG